MALIEVLTVYVNFFRGSVVLGLWTDSGYARAITFLVDGVSGCLLMIGLSVGFQERDLHLFFLYGIVVAGSNLCACTLC